MCAFACIVLASSTTIYVLPVMISSTICTLLLAAFCISTVICLVMFCIISSRFGSRVSLAELLRLEGHTSSPRNQAQDSKRHPCWESDSSDDNGNDKHPDTHAEGSGIGSPTPHWCGPWQPLGHPVGG